ncbi:MAG: methionine aminotransferase [Bacteroidia bacterium]
MPKFTSSLNSKLPKVGTTIFTVMSKLAQEYNAINLSQGFPNFPCSSELVSLVNKYMQQGHNQYAPMQGVLALREAISEKTKKLYGTYYSPETEITITAGATQAIYTAITAIINEGDEVIIFSPAYDCYEPAIELNGGKTIHIHLDFPNYSINWERVKKVVNHRTRMIIINTPHNPSGSILKKEDLLELEKITSGTDIIVVSDEVYEHMVFDGYSHESVAKYSDLASRSFIISSFGKTYHTTGWKIGYCIAPEALMKEFRKVHQYLVFAVNTPIQFALAEYLKKDNEYLELSKFYQQKRDFFRERIKASRFKLLPCQGTYFQLLDYSNITEEKDIDFAMRLIKEHGIASVPVSVFYNEQNDNKVLRFCFAKDEQTLEKAAEIICKI